MGYRVVGNAFSCLVCLELVFPYALHRQEVKKKSVKTRRNMGFRRFDRWTILTQITTLLILDSAGLPVLKMAFRPDLALKLARVCTRGWSRWILEVPLHPNYSCGSTVSHQTQWGIPLPRGRLSATYYVLVRLTKLEERKMLF